MESSMNLFLSLFSFLLIQLFFTTVGGISSSHQTNIPVEISTRYGRIRGYESIFLHKRVRSFLSVPFAEPPVGEMRFRPPIYKKPWNGTIDASTLAPSCFQGRDSYNESFWGSEMWNANTQVKEDCLYMNIWTPAEGSNLTVMVWLFGGGFYSGSPSLILYDGKALALTANVVVVNINYRVGPFGYLFLDHADAPGNMGMLDQQLALFFIRENIRAFGGDPAKISLFGESAGASSIVAHLIAPGSRGMFKNGILQSGSLDNKWAMDEPNRAMAKSKQFADLVQCNRTSISATIACLKERPAADLVAQMWNINLGFLEFPFAIVSRDRNFFRELDAFTALRKKEYRRDVNLMIGINHNEGNYWNIYNLAKYFDVAEQPQLSLDDFHDCVNTAFSRLPEMVRNAALYAYVAENCDHIQGKSKFYAEQIDQMVGDYFFTCDSLWLADEFDDSSGQVYIYYFDQPSPANPWPKWTGVMHGYEIEYVFGVPIYNTTAGYINRDQALSRKMIQYWSSFAANGVPKLDKSNKEVDWPAYNSVKSRYWMQLKGGSHFGPFPAKKRKECNVWRNARDMEYNEYLLAYTSRSYSLQVSPIWILSGIIAYQYFTFLI